MNVASAILLAIFGTAVGSFLNVCIHRLPLRKSLMWPASHCPRCQAPVKPYDNIPLLGYMWLRGRCRSCRAPISVQYPIVELATGAVFLGAYLLFDSPAVLIQRLLFASSMIVLFVIDIEHRILPDVITLPGIVLGFVFSLFLPPGWRDSLIGIVLGGGSLWLMGEVYFRLRHEEGMGFGDVKMLAMIGACLGWKLMLLTLVLSSFLGSIVGVGMIAFNRGDMKYALPFGSFLAVGAIVAASVGDRDHRLVRSVFTYELESKRVRVDWRHGDGGRPCRRPHLRGAPLRLCCAGIQQASSRKQERVGVRDRGTPRRADDAEGAGARDVSACGSVRAAEHRNRRKPVVGTARCCGRWASSHPESRRDGGY